MGDPLVDRLQRLRLFKWPVSRTVAVITVFVLMSAALGLILLVILPLSHLERTVMSARGQVHR